MKILIQLKLLPTQERKEFEGKIKLENNLIGTGYNTVLLKVKIL